MRIHPHTFEHFKPLKKPPPKGGFFIDMGYYTKNNMGNSKLERELQEKYGHMPLRPTPDFSRLKKPVEVRFEEPGLNGIIDVVTTAQRVALVQFIKSSETTLTRPRLKAFAIQQLDMQTPHATILIMNRELKDAGLEHDLITVESQPHPDHGDRRRRLQTYTYNQDIKTTFSVNVLATLETPD